MMGEASPFEQGFQVRLTVWTNRAHRMKIEGKVVSALSLLGN